MEFLDDADTARFRRLFSFFDLSGDGHIDARELGVILRALGMDVTEAEVADLVARVDVDGSGSVDFAEFLHLIVGPLADKDPEKELEEAFAALDADSKDGKLSASDLVAAAESLQRPLTEAQAADMIREADTEGKGFASYKDLQAVMKTN